MRSLDDIFTHGEGKRRLLFEDGLWCIYEKTRDDGDKTVYVLHRCEAAEFSLDSEGPWECGATRADSWVAGEVNSGCGETAPDSIKTLATIHRWER